MNLFNEQWIWVNRVEAYNTNFFWYDYWSGLFIKQSYAWNEI